MKRTLAAMLTALMLLAILPLSSLPAQAGQAAQPSGPNIYIGCSVSSAYVGETFSWFAEATGGSGDYGYHFHVFRNGEVFDPEGTRGQLDYRYYTPPLPGKYQVVVLVFDNVSGLSAINASPVINVAATPNKITRVEPVSATSLKITWNKVPGAEDFWLYRSTNKINWDFLDSVAGTSYTDTGLKAGTRYFYKICYNKMGVLYTWYSPAVAGVPMGKTRITSISSPSKGRVRLVWAKAAGASGYQVLVATSARGSYRPVRLLTGNSITLTGLKSGSALYYKVRPYRKIYTTTCWGQYSAFRSVRVK
ncbi:MAG: fibronectin type III domain-containing protein [Bacillota bacterium]|nr:fibronectin type III domain-containing protein [Bacillota bacterium]